ncbi:hypothetical protein SAMN05444000_10113 [Shimia gijangensis]|uniref:Uncharacterized protein n=1 Tax=Shimia gijangensis TaxID=1470563 RepID=A0A1M6APT7_9RHOB|nr:hypothetical protein SAMN05444000_10113 [Shimia gijangensis]
MKKLFVKGWHGLHDISVVIHVSLVMMELAHQAHLI